MYTEDGKTGIKAAGMYGTGGIGKTQLAVEFAYRYRFYFPGGVYWLNAAENWQKELEIFASYHELGRADFSETNSTTVAFRNYLAKQKQESLCSHG